MLPLAKKILKFFLVIDYNILSVPTKKIHFFLSYIEYFIAQPLEAKLLPSPILVVKPMQMHACVHFNAIVHQFRVKSKYFVS